MYPKNDLVKIMTFAALIFSLFFLWRWICEVRVGSLDVKVSDSIIEEIKKARIEIKKRVLNEYFIKELIRKPALVGSSTDDLADVVELADIVFDFSKSSKNYYLPHNVELLTEESKGHSDYGEMVDEREARLRDSQSKEVKIYLFFNGPSKGQVEEGAHKAGYFVLCKNNLVVAVVQGICCVPE